MKGITIKNHGGTDVMEYVDIPDPFPENSQVLIEVRGASVDYADIKARKGDYRLGRTLPFIPGDTCFSLKQAPQAHQLLEDKKALGKVVAVPERFWKKE